MARFKIPVFSGLFVGGVLALAAGCGKSAEVAEYVEPVTNVEYFSVQPGTFIPELTLPITVAPLQEVNLGLTGGGRVTVIHVDKGDRVKKGQVLLETDQVLLEAQFNMAEANLAYQKNELARSEQLFKNGSITQAQYDAVKLVQAQAQTGDDIARKQLANAKLEAPFAGTVTMRNAEIGDILAPGSPAFRIINMDSVKIQAGIPEKYIRDFETGGNVIITFDAIPGRQFEATISYLSPEASAKVRTFPAEMIINNHEGLLRAGIMGSATINRKQIDNAILVPINAVIATRAAAATRDLIFPPLTP